MAEIQFSSPTVAAWWRRALQRAGNLDSTRSYPELFDSLRDQFRRECVGVSPADDEAVITALRRLTHT